MKLFKKLIFVSMLILTGCTPKENLPSEIRVAPIHSSTLKYVENQYISEVFRILNTGYTMCDESQIEKNSNMILISYDDNDELTTILMDSNGYATISRLDDIKYVKYDSSIFQDILDCSIEDK